MGKRTKSRNPRANEGIQANEVHAKAIAVGRGAKAVVTYGASDLSDEIKKAFEVLTNKVESMPDNPDKAVAQSAVSALKAEAEKGDEARENNVSKWLTFLAQAAPDVWEVAISTFLNPIQGLSLVFQKVAQRAKQA
jgi:hypothetical protein